MFPFTSINLGIVTFQLKYKHLCVLIWIGNLTDSYYEVIWVVDSILWSLACVSMFLCVKWGFEKSLCVCVCLAGYVWVWLVRENCVDKIPFLQCKTLISLASILCQSFDFAAYCNYYIFFVVYRVETGDCILFFFTPLRRGIKTKLRTWIAFNSILFFVMSIELKTCG